MKPQDILDLGKRKFNESKLSALMAENKLFGTYNGVSPQKLTTPSTTTGHIGRTILDSAKKIINTIGSNPPFGSKTVFENKPIENKPVLNDFVEPIRQVKVNKEDLEELKYTLFSEISNRTLDKQILEAKTIMNTAFNRAKDMGKTLKEILSAPKQYQGYGSKEYLKAKKGDLDEPSKKKMAAVETAIKLLLSGMMDDNTNGAKYYIHKPNGEIQFGHQYPVK